MRFDRRTAVAIIGAGFSGTMVAAHLARRGIDCIVVESARRAGLGTAYSTTDPAHLLNLRADTMGAWADEPRDFAAREGVDEDAYAERRQFGRYLRSILDESLSSGFVEVIHDRAVAAAREGGRWRVALEGADGIACDAVVLAMGNLPPGSPPVAGAAGDRFICDPWGTCARAAIDNAASRQIDVLILGTGLTMIDVALSLDSAGHRGQAVAVSRRGRLPLGNAVDRPAPVEWEDLPPARIRDLVAWLRMRSSKFGWRAAIDSLRPHSHRLWQSFDVRQKRLFLRHARPWWDIHRHRIAPEIVGRLDELIETSRLQVIAGRVVNVRAIDQAVEVTIRERGEEVPRSPARRFGYIFNCTGPLGEIASTLDPLLRQLLGDGLVHPDEVGIGLAVDKRCRAAHSDRLWALGALTKGRYWEIIAVPDIRNQAAEVAADIATELRQ